MLVLTLFNLSSGIYLCCDQSNHSSSWSCVLRWSSGGVQEASVVCVSTSVSHVWLLLHRQSSFLCSHHHLSTRDRYESGGAFFPAALQRTLVGLVCGQLTLIGYLLTRGFRNCTLFLMPLPMATVWGMRYCDMVRIGMRGDSIAYKS